MYSRYNSYSSGSRPINYAPSSRRSQGAADKNLQILKTLLKEPSNRFCADCKTSSHPRWASWSLGIFICIRCSGIHRSMGTHISKVRSVDLDSWNDEQVKSMIKWGNKKANHFWEYNLPDNYVPDQSKIENFIRTKYDLRKWAMS
ncbi:ADP-ribosylation factor GTPase-activating protein, partial [Ascoidea rubescens DSM 1968]